MSFDLMCFLDGVSAGIAVTGLMAIAIGLILRKRNDHSFSTREILAQLVISIVFCMLDFSLISYFRLGYFKMDVLVGALVGSICAATVIACL